MRMMSIFLFKILLVEILNKIDDLICVIPL